jgi:hypothetical protein
LRRDEIEPDFREVAAVPDCGCVRLAQIFPVAEAPDDLGPPVRQLKLRLRHDPVMRGKRHLVNRLWRVAGGAIGTADENLSKIVIFAGQPES